MPQSNFDFNSVQCFFDLRKLICDPNEKFTLFLVFFLLQYLLIDLLVETECFYVLRDSKVKLLLIQLDRGFL